LQDGVKEKQAYGGEDDVVAGQHLDPHQSGVAVVASEHVLDGQNHGQQGGQKDGEEDQRQQELAVAAADGEGGEEGAVGDQGPGAQRDDQQQEPWVSQRVEVIEDEKDGAEDELNEGDEEEVGEDFGEKEGCSVGGGHAQGVDDLMADFAGPGLIESRNAGEERGYAEDSAGNFAGGGGGGVEGHAEEDDDEQGEEEHGVDGFSGAPLDAEVFAKVGADEREPAPVTGTGC